MIKIAICDDDPLFINIIKQEVTQYFETQEKATEIICFDAGKPLLISSVSFDLYLLDIQLPDFSGLELADIIRKHHPLCSIIFISNIHHAVYDSLRYAPLRFIRKEFLDLELSEALDAFYNAYIQKNTDTFIQIKNKEFNTTIKASAITHIVCSGHYLDIFTPEQTYRVRGKISDYETQLKDDRFSRINQGVLVNLKHIKLLSGNLIIMNNDTQLCLSRNYKMSFQSSFMKYQREVVHAVQF